jgi:hypothetical protein
MVQIFNSNLSRIKKEVRRRILKVQKRFNYLRKLVQHRKKQFYLTF